MPEGGWGHKERTRVRWAKTHISSCCKSNSSELRGFRKVVNLNLGLLDISIKYMGSHASQELVLICRTRLEIDSP